jgi:hypothetical protein
MPKFNPAWWLALDGTGVPARLAWRRLEEQGVLALQGARQGDAMMVELARLVENWGPPCALGVLRGPGSFTGIRATIAAARALAMGWSLPLFAGTHFDLLAGQAPPDAALACPAGRNRYYLLAQGLPSGLPSGLPVAEPRLVGAAELPQPCFGAPGQECLQPVAQDPVLFLLESMHAGRLQPVGEIEAWYGKPADALPGTCLLEKLLQR